MVEFLCKHSDGMIAGPLHSVELEQPFQWGGRFQVCWGVKGGMGEFLDL